MSVSLPFLYQSLGTVYYRGIHSIYCPVLPSALLFYWVIHFPVPLPPSAWLHLSLSSSPTSASRPPRLLSLPTPACLSCVVVTIADTFLSAISDFYCSPIPIITFIYSTRQALSPFITPCSRVIRTLAVGANPTHCGGPHLCCSHAFLDFQIESANLIPFSLPRRSERAFWLSLSPETLFKPCHRAWTCTTPLHTHLHLPFLLDLVAHSCLGLSLTTTASLF